MFIYIIQRTTKPETYIKYQRLQYAINKIVYP